MIERLLTVPTDYTFFELKGLTSKLGCRISQKKDELKCVIIAVSGAKLVFHKPYNYSYFKEYKGYIGSIEADADSDILYGRVQNLKNQEDVVTYEGESIKELRKDFQEAIDYY